MLFQELEEPLAGKADLLRRPGLVVIAALEYLERAVQSLPDGPFEKDAWMLDTLAEAYFQAGDLTRAIVFLPLTDRIMDMNILPLL